MKTNDQRYMGYSAYKMDPKCRVSIPASWRPDSGEALYLLVSKAHELPVIKVLNQEAYRLKVEQVKASDWTVAKKTAALGRLAHLCRTASVNDQGKLLVPKELSESVGISAESDVVLVGRGVNFEIYSKANHEAVLAIESVFDEDDELGIF